MNNKVIKILKLNFQFQMSKFKTLSKTLDLTIFCKDDDVRNRIYLQRVYSTGLKY